MVLVYVHPTASINRFQIETWISEAGCGSVLDPRAGGALGVEAGVMMGSLYGRGAGREPLPRTGLVIPHRPGYHGTLAINV